ncbi:MAG: hypothetical protein ACT4PT_11830 [Methanobacteriota archaeon]
MRRLAVLAVLLVSGCLSSTENVLLAPSGELSFGAASGLPSVATERTLALAPALALGEWWTYRLDVATFGVTEEFTLIVAGVDEEDFLVGVPLDATPGAPFIMHVPGIGEVSRSSLSYEAHDEPMELLRFPLVAGDSWGATYWGSQEMTVEVVEAGASVADLRLETAGGVVAEYTYDAAIGALVSYVAAPPTGPGWELSLLDHGFGYEGAVRVPYGQDLVFCHGRAVGVIAVEACSQGDPSPPQGMIEVPGSYDAATVALVLSSGALGGEPAAGLLQISATDPAGNRREERLLPGETGKMAPWSLEEPVGVWRYEATVVGPGFAILEGVAYRAIDVEIPSGELLD